MIYKINDKVQFITSDGVAMVGQVSCINEKFRTLEVYSLGRVYDVPEENVTLYYDAMQEQAVDMVNHPKHYSSKPDGIETIKIVDHMVVGLKPRAAVRIGNATKYIDRHQEKNGKEDIKKAIWYLQDYVDHYEEYNKM